MALVETQQIATVSDLHDSKGDSAALPYAKLYNKERSI